MAEIKNVVLGVTGGIAAYKAAEITSRLKKGGYDVRCIMTENAQKFLPPLTLRTLSNHPVICDLFQEPEEWNVEHIALAKWADVFVIAPATANIIGKMAAGIADDFLSTTVMATKAPIVLAPAMNAQMYESEAFQENMAILRQRGCQFIEPVVGNLACGDTGKGKMEEPAAIVAYIEQMNHRDLEGLKLLVTAGPTREALDPVRFLTNHSSGKMGYALAKMAQKRGAAVTLVSGPVNLAPPQGVEVVPVVSALEMYEAVLSRFPEQNAVIKCAAVADYRPKTYHEQKLKKKEGPLTLQLVRNPDILAQLGKTKTTQILAGFAAETHDLAANAKRKLAAKNLDFICANDVAKEGGGFGSDHNTITIYFKDGRQEALPMMTKEAAADKILDEILKLWLEQ